MGETKYRNLLLFLSRPPESAGRSLSGPLIGVLSQLTSAQNLRHKGPDEFWSDGKAHKIARRFHKRILDHLDLLEQALILEDLNVVGFIFILFWGVFRRAQPSILIASDA